MRHPTQPTGAQISNILHVWRRATTTEREDGRLWYRRAHGAAIAIHEDTGHTLDTVAAIVRATSPNNAWGSNLDQARALCHAVGDELDLIPVSTYDAGAKARRILRGELEARCGKLRERHVVAFSPRAPKTGAFFRLILDPSADAVVVDGHAWCIAHNERRSLDSVPQLAGNIYRQVANAYRRAADILGEDPATVQAVTWLAWRRIHETARTHRQDPDLRHHA
jgi:hypothetical protein